MIEQEIRKHCLAQGIPFIEEGERLRVMDVTLLPGTLRASFDERGCFKPETVEAAAEEGQADSPTPPPATKRRKTPAKRKVK